MELHIVWPDSNPRHSNPHWSTTGLIFQDPKVNSITLSKLVELDQWSSVMGADVAHGSLSQVTS